MLDEDVIYKLGCLSVDELPPLGYYYIIYTGKKFD